MTYAELAIWYTAVCLGLFGSALFSGLETGIYTINRVRLHVQAHRARSRAAVLERLLQRPNRLLGTLLVGNNIANYLASLAVAALLSGAGYGTWQQVAINAGILTPLLFVFGEVLPKDLFRIHSDRLTYPMARPLAAMQWILTIVPIVPMIGVIAGGLRRVLGADRDPTDVLHPRRVVTELFREGAGQGAISDTQSDILERAMQAGDLTTRDVMIPWSQVVTAHSAQPPEAIWSLADRVPHARLPLLDAKQRPVGILEVFEVLRRHPDDCGPIQELAHPLETVRPNASLYEALRTLQERRAVVAVVADDPARPLGLITTKDLVQPIIGKLESW